MATLQENLEKLISTKKNIKLILELYSTDTITDLFSTYADLILNLYTSKTCLNSLFEGSTDSTFSISVSFPWTNVVGTAQMFKDCVNLTTLDISTWDMSKNKKITYMFNRTYSLESLNVSNWDLRSCTEATRFVQLTSSLKRLDLSTWKNTGNITNYSHFLNNFGLSVIEYLDISSLDTTSVVAKTSYDGNPGLYGFFQNCVRLDTIIFGEAFGKCKVAITLDLTTVGAHWYIEDGAEGSEIKYQLNSKTYESMLTMYDRATAGLPAMTIKFSSRHNIPEGWVDKMTARGYTITIV